jgi:hypothetical protein
MEPYSASYTSAHPASGSPPLLAGARQTDGATCTPALDAVMLDVYATPSNVQDLVWQPRQTPSAPKRKDECLSLRSARLLLEGYEKLIKRWLAAQQSASNARHIRGSIWARNSGHTCHLPCRMSTVMQETSSIHEHATQYERGLICNGWLGV